MKKNKKILNEELNAVADSSSIEQAQIVEVSNEKKVEEPLLVEAKIEEPLPIEAEEPLPIEAEIEEPLPVEAEAEEFFPVETEIEEPLLAEIEAESAEIEETEHHDILLTGDHQEESTDSSDEVAVEFDKELHSAKDQPEQTAGLESQPEEAKEEDKEVIPNYQLYDPEALIDALEVLLREDTFESIKGRVSAIKLAFLEHEKVARMAAKTTTRTAKGVEEQIDEFVFPLSERFNAVFDLYKQKKTRFMEDLEK
jgi:hypothetical protein